MSLPTAPTPAPTMWGDDFCGRCPDLDREVVALRARGDCERHNYALEVACLALELLAARKLVGDDLIQVALREVQRALGKAPLA